MSKKEDIESGHFSSSISSRGAVNHKRGWILKGFPFTLGPKAAGESAGVRGRYMTFS